MLKKLFCVLALTTPLSVLAQTPSSSFDVTVKTISGCTIEMSDIHLGVLEGRITAAIKPVNLNVTCTKNTPYNIKSPVAQGIESPVQSGYFFVYIYPLYHKTDPVHREFIGYRFISLDPLFSNNPSLNFLGDGTTNDRNAKTTFIKGIGSGSLQTISFSTEYYTYILLKAGDYTASHSFTITY